MLGALLAYAHYASILLIAIFIGAEVLLLRSDLGARAVDALFRADIGYFSAATAALITGSLRLGFSENGAMFFMANGVFWAKVLLFFTVAALSLIPTHRYSHWRRQSRMDIGYSVPSTEARSTRRIVTAELSFVLLLPLLGALAARGIGL